MFLTMLGDLAVFWLYITLIGIVTVNLSIFFVLKMSSSHCETTLYLATYRTHLLPAVQGGRCGHFYVPLCRVADVVIAIFLRSSLYGVVTGESQMCLRLRGAYRALPFLYARPRCWRSTARDHTTAVHVVLQPANCMHSATGRPHRSSHTHTHTHHITS